jgi:hypothetical protein
MRRTSGGVKKFASRMRRTSGGAKKFASGASRTSGGVKKFASEANRTSGEVKENKKIEIVPEIDIKALKNTTKTKKKSKATIEGNILENECNQILRTFFQNRRNS